MPLITDRDPTTGFVRERRVLKRLLKGEEPETPEMADRYAEKMSSFLGVPEGKVKQSEPFKNYLRRLRK